MRVGLCYDLKTYSNVRTKIEITNLFTKKQIKMQASLQQKLCWHKSTSPSESNGMLRKAIRFVRPIFVTVTNLHDHKQYNTRT